MNNVKSKRAYKAYTAFTNIVTVKRHHITTDASSNLLKRRIPALLQYFTTDHLRGHHHLQSILLWCRGSAIAALHSALTWESAQTAPTCNMYVRYLSFT
jgi:hypothetical protein